MIKGIDYLGGVNYRRVIKRHHPDGYAAGFLMCASGWKNGILAARALAKTGKCKVMRLHGIWHDNHSFRESDIKPAVREACKVKELADDFPGIKFYYSPWLEHYELNALFSKCAKECRKVLGRKIKIVNCGTFFRKNQFKEFHRSVFTSVVLNEPCIFSYDGFDMLKYHQAYIRDDIKHFRKATIFFGWTPHCNGRRHLHDTTPRHRRKAWLTAKDIKAMVRRMGK